MLLYVMFRLPGEVPGTGSVPVELGRGFRHLQHAGDRSSASSTAGGLRPALQDTGARTIIIYKPTD